MSHKQNATWIYKKLNETVLKKMKSKIKQLLLEKREQHLMLEKEYSIVLRNFSKFLSFEAWSNRSSQQEKI